MLIATNGPVGPLNHALIESAQPKEGWLAPVTQRYKEEVGTTSYKT